MFKKRLAALFIAGFVCNLLFAQQFSNEKITVDAKTGKAFDCLIYKPVNFSESKTYALVLYFHSIGEAGTDVNKLYTTGLPKVLKGGYQPSFEFIMIAPQDISYSMDPAYLGQLLDESLKKYPNIDPAKVYLTGIGEGGYPAFASQTNISVALAQRFAGLVVMSGAAQNVNAKNYDWWKTSKTPLWAVVGYNDISYREQDKYLVNQVNNRVPGIASITIRPGVSHGGWDDVYNGDVKTSDGKTMWQWLQGFSRTDSGGPGSGPVVIGDGTSQQVLIDLGAVATNVDQWGKYWNNMSDARPGVRITNAKTIMSAATTVSLEVVNRIDGSFSIGSKGINTGSTTGIVGQYPASATTDFAFAHKTTSTGKWRIFGLDDQKTYTIKFWGTKTATANYTIQIKRSDETQWQEYNASKNINYNTGATFSFTGKKEMNFDIRTKMGSDFGYISLIDIAISGGQSGGSTDPSFTDNAGADKTVTLPANSVTMEGSAALGVSSYKWTKTAGPAQFAISNANIANPVISNLVAGVYTFLLTATNGTGLTATDEVKVTVGAGTANAPPVANAGADKTISLPTNSVSLSGSGSDPNGSITSYNWQKTAGPIQFTLSSSSIANPVANNLVAGTYSFRLTVTDNNGGTGTDDVNVIVNGQPGTGTSHILQFNAQGDAYYPNALGLNWKAGDTVYIPAGNYGLIDLGNIKGAEGRPIVIINKGGLVTVRQIRLNNKMEYFKIMGNGAPGVTYGIKVNNTTADIAFAAAMVSDLEIAYVEVSKGAVGMMIKKNPVATDPSSQYPNYKIKNLKIHHNYVHDTDTEGMYIGSTTPSGTAAGIPIRLENVEINNNTLERTGWDGIQMSSAIGTNSIHDNVVRNFGTANSSSQQTGIAIGGGATGDIYNNTISNGTGWGINAMGFGTIRIYNNLIENVGATGIAKGAESIYADDRITGPESHPKQQMIVTGNTIKNPQPDGAIRVGAYTNNSLPSTISNNVIYLPNAASNWLTFYVVSNALGSLISGNTVIR